MPDTIGNLLAAWIFLCLFTLALIEAYYRGKNRGFDDANKLHDQFMDDALRKRGYLP